MRSKKPFLYFILLIALVAGGVYGYIYYHVKKQADRVVRILAPVAKIKYGGILVDFRGDVGVKDITITLYDEAFDITIESIIFHAPDLLFLLDKGKQVQQGKVPDEIGLSVNHVVLDLFSESTQALLKAKSVSCGNLDYATALQQMDYDKLDSSVRIDYKFVSDTQTMNLDIKAETVGMSSFSTSMTMKVGVSDVSFFNAFYLEPSFARFSLSYVEGEGFYTDRLKRYCMETSKKDLDAVVELLLEATVDNLQNFGIALGGDLIESYRQFLLQPDEIVIEMAPSRPLDTSKLHLYKLDDVFKMLNTTVLINQKPVETLHVETTKTFLGIPPSNKVSKTQTEKDKEKARDKLVQKYRDQPISSLAKHIGRQVYVFQKNGKKIRGRIKSVSEHTVLVKARARDAVGFVMYRIPKKDIEKIQVLLFGSSVSP